jgi:hypothetical protein
VLICVNVGKTLAKMGINIFESVKSPTEPTSSTRGGAPTVPVSGGLTRSQKKKMKRRNKKGKGGSAIVSKVGGGSGGGVTSVSSGSAKADVLGKGAPKSLVAMADECLGRSLSDISLEDSKSMKTANNSANIHKENIKEKGMAGNSRKGAGDMSESQGYDRRLKDEFIKVMFKMTRVLYSLYLIFIYVH